MGTDNQSSRTICDACDIYYTAYIILALFSYHILLAFLSITRIIKWIWLRRHYWQTQYAVTVETRIKPNQWRKWINLPKYQRFMVTLCHYLSIHAIFMLYLCITVTISSLCMLSMACQYALFILTLGKLCIITVLFCHIFVTPSIHWMLIQFD